MVGDFPIAIREATENDVSSLALVAERTFRDAFGEFNTAADMDEYVGSTFTEQNLLEELRDPDSTFLVAEVAGEIVGYAKLQRGVPADCIATPSPIELARLYVLERWHGHGPGSELLRAVMDRSISEGYESLWLGVWEHNARAIGFYRKCKFQPVGRQKFVLGSDVQQDLVLVCSLTGTD